MGFQFKNAFPIFVVLVAMLPCTGQKISSPGAQPKIGLVLEGGGALGLAHIGVIQYLEEHRIPTSYIAGTSMGGLVGGVYATGRSATEVRDVVKDIKWDQVISGQTPFDDLSYRRKQDAREYPSTLEFGLRHGLQFPSGSNAGQQVDLILDRVALPYSQVTSFDDLPIPFACVATDLVTKSEHVFRSGPLDLALRATMSLPGIFSPVRSDGHIYVDGGLLNNIPVTVAKEMGADVVLGIHLATAPLKPDTALSSFAVLGEAIEAVIAANEREAMRSADLIVTVPLQQFTSTDYDKADQIIKAGYDAAAASAEKLAVLSVDEVTWERYLAERKARRKNASTPRFVNVAGVPPDIAEPITAEASNFAGHPVDTAALDHHMLELTGTGPFSSVNYSIIEREGNPGLNIQAESKPYSPPIVRPLIVINGADYNDVFFSIGARVTFLNFGGYRRELRGDVIVGSEYGLNTEYYRPFHPTSRWFVAPRMGLNSSQYPLFHVNELVALYRNRLVGGGLDVGYNFGNIGELRLGYEGGYQHLSPEVGSSAELPTVSGVTGDVRAQYVFDTLDDPVIPRHGAHIKADLKYFNANPDAPSGFPLSQLQIEDFVPISKSSSVFLNASGGTTYGYRAGIPPFALGGVNHFLAYGTNELLTDQYVLGQFGYIRELKKLPPLLGSSIDFLGAFEIGKISQLPNGPKPLNLPMDVTGALVLNTLFGPVQGGVAFGNYGRAKFFFQVGRIF